MAKKQQTTFEDKLERLDLIVQSLDEGTLPIEDMLKMYEEGMVLIGECRDYLHNAEQKITIIENSQNK